MASFAEHLAQRAAADEQEAVTQDVTAPVDIPYKVHCLHCRAVRDLKEPERGQTAKGRNCVRGKCAECGSSCARFI